MHDIEVTCPREDCISQECDRGMLFSPDTRLCRTQSARSPSESCLANTQNRSGSCLSFAKTVVRSSMQTQLRWTLVDSGRPSVKDKNPDEIGAFDGRLGRLVDVRVKAVNYCAITYTGSRLEPDMVCTGGIEKTRGRATCAAYTVSRYTKNSSKMIWLV